MVEGIYGLVGCYVSEQGRFCAGNENTFLAVIEDDHAKVGTPCCLLVQGTVEGLGNPGRQYPSEERSKC
jgi:hypothetical protein